jgi:hypothetical protein
MLFERHLGHERSLSSPFTTRSRYSCPHIMHRNVSKVIVAIRFSDSTAGQRAAAEISFFAGIFLAFGCSTARACSISSIVTVFRSSSI